MPSSKRRITPDALFAAIPSDLLDLCEHLLVLHENNWPAFAEAVETANASLSKHETGFVLGFLAACLEPGEGVL